MMLLQFIILQVVVFGVVIYFLKKIFHGCNKSSRIQFGFMNRRPELRVCPPVQRLKNTRQVQIAQAEDKTQVASIAINLIAYRYCMCWVLMRHGFNEQKIALRQHLRARNAIK